MKEILCLLLGYVFGFILTAEPVARIKTGHSVFEIGSRNPGMANVMANIGKKEGLFVLLGDIVKTVLAILLAGLLTGRSGPMLILWTGLGAAAGHDYPIWHRFRGGKGVTVTVTTIILAFPVWGTLISVFGGIVTILTGDLWLGAILIPLAALPLAFIRTGATGAVLVSLFFVLSFIKNAGGVLKVIKGEEYRRFRRKK